MTLRKKVFSCSMIVVLVFGLLFSLVLAPAVTLAAPGEVIRIGGLDRYATSSLVAANKYIGGNTKVIITRGDVYADGLAASTLAGALNCPVLLTKVNELPASVNARIDALGATEAIILGGTAAVSATVETALKTKLGVANVKRIGGIDRYQTAALIAAEADASPAVIASYAFIVNGEASADSLVAGPAAFKDKAPILQVRKDSIPAVTVSSIASLGITRLYVVGGTAVVSDAVLNELAGITGVTNVVRVSGATRYETSVAFANYFASSVFAGGRNFSLVRGADNNLADAIGATVFERPILYVEQLTIPLAVKNYLDLAMAQTSEIYVIGGTAAVAASVFNTARDILDTPYFSLFMVNESDTNAKVLDLTIKGDTFKTVAGGYLAGTHYTITGLPSGVTATLAKNSDTVAKLTLAGSPTLPLTADAKVSLVIKAAALTASGDQPATYFLIVDELPTIAIGAGQEIQPAGAAFDATFNLTLTNDHFAATVNSTHVTLGGVFAGATKTLTRLTNTTATLRIQGNMATGTGTFKIGAGSLAGSSDSNVVSITVTSLGASFGTPSIFESLTNAAANVITITGDTFQNIAYVAGTHYTITGLPAGVTATLARENNTQAILTLSGTPNQPFYANATVSVVIKAAALAGSVDIPAATFVIADQPPLIASVTSGGTANASYDVTFAITLTRDHFSASVDPAGVTLGGVFAEKTKTVVRVSDTQITVRVQGNVSANDGTITVGAANFVGSSGSNTLTKTVASP